MRHVGHPDRPGTLLHLAEVLLYSYGKLGLEDFPGEILQFASEVQGSCSVDSHARRAADLAQQTYALYKAISSGSLADIDRLIPALRQAVKDIPHNYFDKLQRLTNLSLALRIHYEFYRNLGDLDESNATHEEAMRLDPCGLDPPTHTQFLKEWAKATLAGGSWKDALVVAASVCISLCSGNPRGIDPDGSQFTLARVTLYRVICERLEAIDRLTDAIECFHEMMSELGEEVYMSGPMTMWVSGEFMFYLFVCYKFKFFSSDFTQRCLSAPGVHATPDSPTPTPLLREWGKATLRSREWKDALVVAASVSISFFAAVAGPGLTLLACSSHFLGLRSIGSYVNVSKR